MLWNPRPRRRRQHRNQRQSNRNYISRPQRRWHHGHPVLRRTRSTQWYVPRRRIRVRFENDVPRWSQNPIPTHRWCKWTCNRGTGILDRWPLHRRNTSHGTQRRVHRCNRLQLRPVRNARRWIMYIPRNRVRLQRTGYHQRVYGLKRMQLQSHSDNPNCKWHLHLSRRGVHLQWRVHKRCRRWRYLRWERSRRVYWPIRNQLQPRSWLWWRKLHICRMHRLIGR